MIVDCFEFKRRSCFCHYRVRSCPLTDCFCWLQTRAVKCSHFIIWMKEKERKELKKNCPSQLYISDLFWAERMFHRLSSLYCFNTVLNSFFKNPSSTEIDHLVDSAVRSLRLTLDSIAPLKKKLVKHSKLAPWYNPKTHELKQVSRKLERKWRSNNSIEYLLDWKNSVRVYKKALHKARAAYYSKLIEENKNNPRFLFSICSQADRESQLHRTQYSSIPK